MHEIRLATTADAAIIARQRMEMFAAVGHALNLPELEPAFLTWVTPRLADGTYIGWLVEHGGAILGGAGLWLMDFPPHFLDIAPRRAYLLNFYVAPEARGQRLAGKLLALCVEEARRQGVKVVTLHASKFGKPIYERFGFKQTNEMRIDL